jgi:predicted transcriptional regulator
VETEQRSGLLAGISAPDTGENTGIGVGIGAALVGAALAARGAGAGVALSAAGSSGSLLGALVALLREWLARVLAIIGYRRYSDDDPLEHEAREALYEQICASPGSYLAELSDETGVAMQTARYHLRILEFENLVTRESIRGRRRFFPVGTEWAELQAALQDQSTAELIDALDSQGPDSVSGLAEMLDRDPSTISHHLDRLADDGVVERERDGRAVVNRLSTRAQQALAGAGTQSTRPKVPGEAD